MVGQKGDTHLRVGHQLKGQDSVKQSCSSDMRGTASVELTHLALSQLGYIKRNECESHGIDIKITGEYARCW